MIEDECSFVQAQVLALLARSVILFSILRVLPMSQCIKSAHYAESDQCMPCTLLYICEWWRINSLAWPRPAELPLHASSGL